MFGRGRVDGTRDINIPSHFGGITQKDSLAEMLTGINRGFHGFQTSWYPINFLTATAQAPVDTYEIWDFESTWFSSLIPGFPYPFLSGKE